jgi:Mn2+/Fe2+ NRAMP family transporter
MGPVGTVGGMALSLASVNPIKLLVLVAVISGVTAGPFLIVVMRVSPDRAIMGESINGALAGGSTGIGATEGSYLTSGHLG